jgi:tetratricopeptide (TPR) repeat protein
LEEEGYRFHHDTLRACVYNDCPPARRPLLHQRALAATINLRPDNTLALLFHADQAQDETAVACYALRAGQEALSRFAFSDAQTYFSQALELLPPENWADRFTGLAGRAAALSVQAHYDQLQRDLLQLQEAADHLSDPGLKAEVLWRRAEFAWIKGELELAQQLAEAGLDLAKEVDDIVRVAAFMETLARIARNRGDFHLAQAWVTQAHELFTAVADQFGQASTLDKLANLAYEMGDNQRAIDLHQQSAQLFHELGATPYESRCLSGLALNWKALGEYEKSRQTHPPNARTWLQRSACSTVK